MTEETLKKANILSEQIDQLQRIRVILDGEDIKIRSSRSYIEVSPNLKEDLKVLCDSIKEMVFKKRKEFENL